MTRGPKEGTTLQSGRCGGRWLEIRTRGEGKKKKTQHEYKGNEQKKKK